MSRIYILFADEPVFHPNMLRVIALARPGDLVGVGAVRHRAGAEGRLAYYRKQFSFWGPKGFAVNATSVAMHALLGGAPLPVALKGFHSLRAVSRAHGIPFRIVDDVNEPAFVEFLKGQELDVIVSSQGQIFRPRLLAASRLACINRHSSLLPQYGGLKPVFWAMLHGEAEVGVSVHVMEEAIDRGRVLAQIRVRADSGKGLYELYKDVFDVSGTAILRALDVLEGNGSAPSMDDSSPSYFREPSASDIRRFRQLGNRMA